MKVGLEIHTILEFYNMTLPEARGVTSIIKKMAADAQLHGRDYTQNPLHEGQDKKGELREPRRVSVFIEGHSEIDITAKLQGLYLTLNMGNRDYEVMSSRMIRDGRTLDTVV